MTRFLSHFHPRRPSLSYLTMRPCPCTILLAIARVCDQEFLSHPVSRFPLPAFPVIRLYLLLERHNTSCRKVSSSPLDGTAHWKYSEYTVGEKMLPLGWSFPSLNVALQRWSIVAEDHLFIILSENNVGLIALSWASLGAVPHCTKWKKKFHGAFYLSSCSRRDSSPNL